MLGGGGEVKVFVESECSFKFKKLKLELILVSELLGSGCSFGNQKERESGVKINKSKKFRVTGTKSKLAVSRG